jgi:hypothetical protein
MGQLELDSKSRKRVGYCPCNKSNSDGKFVPYKGHEKFGYCHSCGDTFTPSSGTLETQIQAPRERPTFFHDKGLIKQTVKKNGDNNFIRFLRSKFADDFVDRAIAEYFIGTSKHWPGATIFWQVDNDMKVRHGKIMLYDSETGKRSKTRFNTVRNILGLQDTDEKLQQCLFGLHLATVHKKKSIAIVEGEKTAVIMSMIFPEYLFMSTGGKGNFKYDMLKPIKGHRIIAFPDLDGVADWQKEADKLNKYGFNIDVDSTLQSFDVDKNSDIADIFLSKMQGQRQHSAPTTKEAPPTPKRLPSDQDLIAQRMLEVNPLFQNLVDELDLVHGNGMEVMFN